jgi:hypothetical protein
MRSVAELDRDRGTDGELLGWKYRVQSQDRAGRNHEQPM